MKTIQLDRDVLNNLYGDCPESMIEIFSDFLDGYAELRKNLFSAYQSGNLNTIKRVLHFHGPSFMYLGIPQAAVMFKSLEKRCTEVDNHFSFSSDFTELMQTIETSYLQAKNEIEILKKAS